MCMYVYVYCMFMYVWYICMNVCACASHPASQPPQPPSHPARACHLLQQPLLSASPPPAREPAERQRLLNRISSYSLLHHQFDHSSPCRSIPISDTPEWTVLKIPLSPLSWLVDGISQKTDCCFHSLTAAPTFLGVLNLAEMYSHFQAYQTKTIASNFSDFFTSPWCCPIWRKTMKHDQSDW